MLSNVLKNIFIIAREKIITFSKNFLLKQNILNLLKSLKNLSVKFNLEKSFNNFN